MQDKPLPNPNHEVYASERSKGARRKEASIKAGYKGNRAASHAMETQSPHNGIQDRIAYLQATRFNSDEIDEEFISGCLTLEATSPENKGSERISALKVLADIKKLTGVQTAHVEPEKLSKAERQDMLKQLLWHAQREAEQANIIDVEPIATVDTQDTPPAPKPKRKRKQQVRQDAPEGGDKNTKQNTP